MAIRSRNLLPVQFTAAACLTAALFGACRASEVLSYVPRESLAVVVARDLAAVDTKAQTLAGQLRLTFPSPWTALRLVAGIDSGVNERGECLVALLPPQPTVGTGDTAANEQVSLCAMIPVNDFPALVRSLGGDPERAISRIIVAGQNLIIARRGQWAVVMDEVARPRLERLLEEEPRPLEELEWIRCLETSDVAAVVFRPAVQELKRRLAGQLGDDLPGAGADDNAEGASPSDVAQEQGELFSTGLYKLLIDLPAQHLRRLLAERPEAEDLVGSTESLAVGLQIDDESRVRIRVDARLVAGSALAEQLQRLSEPGSRVDATRVTLRNLAARPFLALGGGELPEPTRFEIARHALQETLQGLRTAADDPYDEQAVAELFEALRIASSQVTDVQFASRPAANEDGIFSNSFLLLTSSDAAKLRAGVLEIERHWDRVMASSRLRSRLTLDRRELEVAGRPSIEFSADMVDALGLEELSEARSVMEKMFGAGGRLRMQLVTLDEQTLLLGTASQAQTVALLADLDRTASAGTSASSGPSSATLHILQLLPADSRFVLLLDPHELTRFEWQMNQIQVGTVIGRPAIRVFAEGPPIGIAVAITEDGGGLAAEAVALPETVKGLGDYLRSSR